MSIGGDFTRHLLKDAGIMPGMRVLDIGCGMGDVSLLAAALACPQGGAVTGVDLDEAFLDIARGRAQDAGVVNIQFRQGDLHSLPAELGPFDAIVGRRVLMYLADPVQAVRGLLALLNPGGLFVIHEHDTTMVPACHEKMPLHHKVQAWIKETLKREGADIHMGFNLYGVLSGAGLAVEQVRAEAIVQTPGQKYPVVNIIRAMLPRIVHHEVATPEEIELDTLDDRLDLERITTNTTYVGDMMFGAWARKPA